jgi:hypothetical protein
MGGVYHQIATINPDRFTTNALLSIEQATQEKLVLIERLAEIRACLCWMLNSKLVNEIISRGWHVHRYQIFHIVILR